MDCDVEGPGLQRCFSLKFCVLNLLDQMKVTTFTLLVSVLGMNLLLWVVRDGEGPGLQRNFHLNFVF